MVAKVRWFDDGKGYGFADMDGGESVYCHYKNINMSGFRTLKVGCIIEFELYEEETYSGQTVWLARNITVRD